MTTYRKKWIMYMSLFLFHTRSELLSTVSNDGVKSRRKTILR